MPDNNQKEKIDHGKTLAAWIFPEFIVHKRGKAWYLTALILTAAVLIWSIFAKNYLFILIIVIIGIIFILQNRQSPPLIECRIKEDGIELSRNFYPFHDLKKFYIIYQPPLVKNIYFDFKSAVRPTLPIPLEKENPLKIREILKKYLDEDLEKEDEPTSDALSRVLKI
ncbi:MAG: hypothetical protein WC528_01085 [Patescibacteria group bacterium]